MAQSREILCSGGSNTVRRWERFQIGLQNPFIMKQNLFAMKQNPLRSNTKNLRSGTKSLRNETESLRTQTRDQRTTSLCQRRTSEGETVNSRTRVGLWKSFFTTDRG